MLSARFVVADHAILLTRYAKDGLNSDKFWRFKPTTIAPSPNRMQEMVSKRIFSDIVDLAAFQAVGITVVRV